METQTKTDSPIKAKEDFRLSFKEKLAYGLGDGAYQLSCSTSFLNMYLTDVLGISLKQVRNLMLITRIWDAVNDPIWGWIVDNSKPGKHGKFRKYLLYIPLPLVIVSILMFTHIKGLTQMQYLAWAYITYTMSGMLITAVSVPYGSLIGVISPKASDRTSLSMFRNIGAGVGLAPPAVILPLVVYSTSAEGVPYLDSKKHLISIAAMGLIGIALAWFSFFNTKERLPSAHRQQKLDFAKTIKGFAKNRPFIVISIASMLLIGIQIYLQTINGYLFKDYFAAPGKSSLLPIAQYASTVLIIPFFTKLANRFGKKELCATGAFISALAFLALYMAKTTSPMIYLIYSFFGGIGLSIFTTASWAMVADTIDQQELLSGQREDGMAFAVCSFARKMGHTAAGAGTNILLERIGYVIREGSKEPIAQTLQVAKGMYKIATLVPAVCFLLIFVLLAFAYPFNKKRVAELQEKMEVIREEAAESI